MKVIFMDAAVFIIVCVLIVLITVAFILIDTESQKAQDEVDKLERQRQARLKRMMQDDR